VGIVSLSLSDALTGDTETIGVASGQVKKTNTQQRKLLRYQALARVPPELSMMSRR
jgi:hypothetical protein